MSLRTTARWEKRSATPATSTAPKSLFSSALGATPRLSTIVRIARALKIPPAELLDGVR
jgi:hypothetical protein